MEKATTTYDVKFYGWDNNRESVEKSFICFQMEALDESDAREKVLENERYRVGSPICIHPEGVGVFDEVGNHRVIANIILDFCEGTQDLLRWHSVGSSHIPPKDDELPERLVFDKNDLPAMVEWIRVAVGSQRLNPEP